MNVRFFNPGLTYKKHKTEFDLAIQSVLSKGDLIMREDVEEFEQRLADFVGAKYAVSLNSGTDALYLALRGLRVGPGDEVIVPSRTFVATAQVVVQLGASPVFYDVDEDPLEKITESTRVIMPVHIEGAFGADMERLLRGVAAIKEQFGRTIDIVEDAAQALGATQNGVRAGNFGIAGCFSFYPAKILGAFGDAGGLTTNDESLYRYVKDARNHFKDDAREWGINSRMDNLQAAILNIRFKYLEDALARRRQIAQEYNAAFEHLEITCPKEVEGRVWQDYIIRTELRDDLQIFLKTQGIETLKNNYPFPVPKLPGAQSYEDETLRLPCNENLDDEEIEYVIKNVIEFYEQQ